LGERDIRVGSGYKAHEGEKESPLQRINIIQCGTMYILDTPYTLITGSLDDSE
jgi:hypothetical protein